MKRLPLAIVVAIALTVPATIQTTLDPHDSGIDLIQFWLVARHLDSGGSPHIYSDATRAAILSSAQAADSGPGHFSRALGFRVERSLETYSSPFLYVSFVPLSRLDYDTALAVFRYLSGALLVVGMAGFGRACGAWPIGLLFGLFVLIFATPVRCDLQVANVNSLQVGLLGLTLLAARWPGTEARQALVTGLCLGGITAWKPNTVLCLLLPVADLVLHRHWRLARPLAVGGICGIAAAVSLSLAWLPASAWTQWLTAIAALPDDIIRTDMGNVSPTFLSGFAWLGGPLAAILAACLLAHQTRRPAEPPTSAWWLCTGLLIFNLTARLVWFHYLVLSLPAVLMAATAWCQPDRPSIGRLPRPVAALILCNAVLLLLGIQTLDDAWIGSTPAEHAVRAAFGNGVLLAACVLSNRSEPANHPPDRARTNSSAEPDD